ncbi:MAG TPA: hypothetical protein VGH29_02620 [Candidatus Binataceae bacterium]
MDAKTKADVLLGTMQKMATGGLKPEDWQAFVAAQNDGLRTGPEIGAKVPDFTLPDQDGISRSVASLMGTNGALLVFTRSAQW